MKAIGFMLGLLMLGALGAGNAWADRGGHVHIGVAIGPYWGPWYYPPASYYYPPYYVSPYVAPLVIEQQAPVYLEQQQAPIAVAPGNPAAPVAAAPTAYWYYCAKAKGYYPYVKECPGGWQKVSPKPPGER
jgi:hypothetical protein